MENLLPASKAHQPPWSETPLRKPPGITPDFRLFSIDSIYSSEALPVSGLRCVYGRRSRVSSSYLDMAA